MDCSRIKHLLEKYLEGESSLNEEELLRKYFTENKIIPLELEYAKPMFCAFKSEQNVQVKKEFTNRAKLYSIFGIAASIVIMFGLVFFNFNTNNKVNYITKCNENNKVLKIELSDGNLIWLNKGTIITYPNKTKKLKNIVKIEGEAFIEILNPKRTHYNIEAFNALIKTETICAFNIKANKYAENVNITVKLGGVKVMENSVENGLALLVTNGNYCSVHKTHKLVFASANKDDNYLAWKTGNLIFNSLPMATVSDVLSEYYNINVELKNSNIAYCEFTGQFSNKPIEYVLSKIKTELNIDIYNSKDLITLSGDKCLSNFNLKQ